MLFARSRSPVGYTGSCPTSDEGSLSGQPQLHALNPIGVQTGQPSLLPRFGQLEPGYGTEQARTSGTTAEPGSWPSPVKWCKNDDHVIHNTQLAAASSGSTSFSMTATWAAFSDSALR